MGSKTKTYTHAIRNGKAVAVPVPRGSTDDATTFKENVLGIVAGAALRRLIGRR